MDYQLGLGVLALVVSAYGAYYQRKAVKLATAQAPARKKGLPTLPVWWKTPAVQVMAMLTILCWVPYFQTLVKSYEITNDGTDVGVVKSWGPIVEMPHGNALVEVDGDRIIQHSGKYRLIAICFIWDGTVDVVDVPRIQKSGLHDINRAVYVFV
jgi:hypothetical protein